MSFLRWYSYNKYYCIFMKKNKSLHFNNLRPICVTLLSLAVILTACEDTSISDITEISSNLKEVSKVKDKAIQQAMDLVTDLGVITRGALAEEEVETFYVWTREDFLKSTGVTNISCSPNDTLMYIVNFRNNKGYVILSATSPSPEILAYVENGTLNPTSPISDEWLCMFLRRTMSMNCSPEFSAPLLPPSDDFVSWTVDTIFGPFLTTIWNQGEPFNSFCPIINGRHCPAGCVAIATGQIAAYHEHPSSYNGSFFDWKSIKEDTIPLVTWDILSVASLISDIGRIVNMNYMEEESLVKRDSIVYSLDSLGYHHSDLVDYDFQSCVLELEQNRPVYMIGEGVRNNGKPYGHSWLIDGCLIRSVHAYRIDKPNIIIRDLIQRLVHCNWGFIKGRTGYFRSDAFDPSTPVHVTRAGIDSNIVMIKDIYPND